MDYKINDKIVTIPKLGRTKKITGTRLASILGLNRWNTPFQTWCDITGVYKEPFVDSIYTIAGKAIEPKIIEYLKEKYEDQGKIIDGEEYWGKDFAKRRFDYFPEEPIFGGMWDALLLSKKTNKPRAVIEIKTTKRAEDWVDEVPIYYLTQAMLYAKLVGVKNIIFPVAFLKDEHYADPECFVANDDTVKIFSIRLNDGDIEKYMEDAMTWYNEHVVGLTSPVYDEKADKDALKFLRTNKVDVKEDDELSSLVKIVDELKPQVQELDAKAKALKKAEDAIKAYLLTQVEDGGDSAQIDTSNYTITLKISRSEKEKFDLEGMKLKYPEVYEEFSFTEETETARQTVKAK